MSVLDDIKGFVSVVGNQINITFKNISDFLDLVQTFFVGLGFWVSVLVYFLLLILLITAPLLIFKYWETIKKSYKKMIDNLIIKKIGG